MIVRQATMDDLNEIMTLHRKYHVDSINPEDKKNGFVTTNFTQKQLKELITEENGVTIAQIDGKIVCYAMAASWKFWSEWPLFAYMIQELPNYKLEGEILSVDNSYQYGPICVDNSIRGTGVFEKVFQASLNSMSNKYSIMATFINQINKRSYSAHTIKVSMTKLGTFQFNNNDYYMLVCPTKKD